MFFTWRMHQNLKSAGLLNGVFARSSHKHYLDGVTITPSIGDETLLECLYYIGLMMMKGNNNV